MDSWCVSHPMRLCMYSQKMRQSSTSMIASHLLSRGRRKPPTPWSDSKAKVHAIVVIHESWASSHSSLNGKRSQDENQSIRDTPAKGNPSRHAEEARGIHTTQPDHLPPSVVAPFFLNKKERKKDSRARGTSKATHNPPVTQPAITASMPPTTPYITGTIQIIFQFRH